MFYVQSSCSLIEGNLGFPYLSIQCYVLQRKIHGTSLILSIMWDNCNKENILIYSIFEKSDVWYQINYVCPCFLFICKFMIFHFVMKHMLYEILSFHSNTCSLQRDGSLVFGFFISRTSQFRSTRCPQLASISLIYLQESEISF